MCGIAGILMINGRQSDLQQLKAMTDIISHRGPDGEGQWQSKDKALALGHRRLSILDLSDAASQPMHYLDRYTIVFNGEIYNYIEIKEKLRAKGYAFHTTSDTEVLIAGYDCYGEKVLDHLDGMFAFALWDEQSKKLFCARDRFGEKPFYYRYEPGQYFVFASEMKALFVWGVDQKVNKHMLFNYMAYDVVETIQDRSETFYSNVNRLEAAHSITLQHPYGQFQKNQYWTLEQHDPLSISYEEAVDEFRRLFQVSVQRRMRSDVAIGSSLSGGLDSTSVVCSIQKLLPENSPLQKTFSARFNDPVYDEGSYMKKVADHTGIESFEVWPDATTMVNDLDKLFFHQEEPFGSASIFAQWTVMRLAKEKGVTVLLDGQGADEVLAGYSHYYNPFLRELYRNDKARLRKELIGYTDITGLNYPMGLHFTMEALFPKVIRTLGYLRRAIMTPSYLAQLSPRFAKEFKTDRPPFEVFNDLNASLHFSTTTYGLEKLLRFADRNSMAFSREIRLPFLSHELVEFAFRLPSIYKIRDGWTKSLLRNAMAPDIPSEIAWRKDKLGFRPPQEKWLATPEAAAMVNQAKDFLFDNDYIADKEKNDNWRCLMAAKLLTSDLTKKPIVE